MYLKTESPDFSFGIPLRAPGPVLVDKGVLPRVPNPSPSPIAVSWPVGGFASATGGRDELCILLASPETVFGRV
eukprot:COSAG02_NODE_39011_length_422_cov_0.681115_1_plen_73_part_10